MPKKTKKSKGKEEEIQKEETKKDNKFFVEDKIPKKEIKDQRPEAKDYYKLDVDKAVIDIRIEKTERGLTYNLYIPKIDIGTEALLDEIRKDLITSTSISAGQIADKKAISEMKQRFMSDAHRLLKEKVPQILKETQDFLIGILMQEMLGLGKIEFMINDPNLEEIVIISSKEPIRVYHKKHGWLVTNITPKSEDEIINYSNIIARRVGKQISVLTPLLDAHIVTGDRANAVLYPISTKGNTITIRKFARDPFTIADLIENKTVSVDIAAMVWLAVEYEMNVLISGGTASGKTVFLNACMPFIPPNHRIISMEDTRELMLPEFLYWAPLVTRTPNAEGKGEVSMLDLLVNSLRMRPDRIVLGEIRRQQEAEVLFEAMHTGHSVYATVHADTANETIRRLTNPPINVPPNMLGNVNLNVIMFRDRKRGLRRVSQVAEFMPGKETITANILYRWVPETDEFVTHNKSLAFFDELSRHTGMSDQDIENDLGKKKKILEWIIKSKLNDLESFGRVMNLYYTDKEKLYKAMRTNNISEIKQPVRKTPEQPSIKEIKREDLESRPEPKKSAMDKKYEPANAQQIMKKTEEKKFGIKKLFKAPERIQETQKYEFGKEDLPRLREQFKKAHKPERPIMESPKKELAYERYFEKPEKDNEKHEEKRDFKPLPTTKKTPPQKPHKSEIDQMREEIIKIEGELKGNKTRKRQKTLGVF